MSKKALTQSLHTFTPVAQSILNSHVILDGSCFAQGLRDMHAKVAQVSHSNDDETCVVEAEVELDSHDLMRGKLHVYKRPGSSIWQCSTYLDGKNHRASTKQHEEAKADLVAEEWYLRLRGKAANGEPLASGNKFKVVAEKFISEFEILTVGERSERYVANHRARIKNHLNPYFGEKDVTEITSGMVQEYRAHRVKTNIDWRTNEPKKLARSTLHQEIVCLRQILTVAEAHNWIRAVPTVTPRYKASGKVERRAWFTLEEYKSLRDLTRSYAANPSRECYRENWQDLHDYILIMVNTGLRPDEAGRLQFRDVAVITDEDTKDEILEIDVRQGKRGMGFCKSMPGAVLPFVRLKQRREQTLRAKAKAAGSPNADKLTLDTAERLFPRRMNHILNIVLKELNLKFDREGRVRTAYSLRHTYICLRLIEGANIYQLAKNCRTSVDMIEKFYAAHIKDLIDAAAVNVRKTKKPTKRKPTTKVAAAA